MTTGGGVLAPVVAGSVARAEGDAVDGGPYERLGVRPLLNAAGILTRLGGSLPPREVLAAMERASRQYVQIEELQAAAGRRIAELAGVEAALVTSGAAAALLVGTAACVTRGDPERIRRLPDTSGMPDEVIVQKAHRHEFEHAMRAAGVRLVEIETRDELERAITPRTAMMHFLAYAGQRGQIDAAAWIAIARKHGVPTFMDAAAELPPAANLGGYCKAGFDLAAFSGGKGLRGPQCTGLLLGSKDLVRAATLNNSPYPDSIGRACKVAKEEIVGLVTAVELFLARDHEADRRRWQSIVDEWQAALQSNQKITVRELGPENGGSVPYLSLDWDQAALGFTHDQFLTRLREGDPRIELWRTSGRGLCLTPFMLEPGEEQIVVRRIAEVFASFSR
jgi:L-seryl-tRNA(Ser) seleniumtransferase